MTHDEPDWDEYDSLQQLALLDGEQHHYQQETRRHMKARQKGSGDFNIVNEGAQAGVVSMIADLGLQPNNNPKYKPGYQVAVGVQFLNQRDAKGEVLPDPLTITRTMTFSMNEKAHYRKFVESIFGKKFPSQEDADNFDAKSLLRRAGLFNIVHSTKKEKTYANIDTVMPLPAGMTKPEVVGEPIYYSLDLPAVENSKAYQRLPEWLRKKLDNQLRPVEETAAEETATAEGAASEGDDIPF